MLKEEFESRIGKTVREDDFNFINRVYMAAEGVDKDQFCKEWKSKKLDDCHIVMEITNLYEKQIVARQQWQHTAEQERSIKEQRIRELEDAKADAKKWYGMLDEARAENFKLAKALIACGHENNAAEIIGRAGVVGVKAASGIELNDVDLKFIAETFNKH